MSARVPRAYLAERADLARSLSVAGPDAPVLCDGWRARDLARHLAAQERLAGWPLLLATPFVLAAGPGQRDRIRELVIGEQRSGPADAASFDAAVARLRRRPPALYLLPGLVLSRFVETWTHHEDLRRATGEAVRPPDDTEAILASALRTMARFVAPLPEVDLELHPHGGSPVRIGRRPGRPLVRLDGRPGELLLWVIGRRANAEVDMAPDERRLLPGSMRLF